MEQYPETLLELEQQFADETSCVQYLSDIRWPDGFECPSCKSHNAWQTKRNLYHCKDCGIQTSVTAGTIFQSTRKPLVLWFRAIWYIVSQKNGISARGLQRALGLTRYETTWELLHKIRKAMIRPGRERLSGVVEVDEVYIGGEHTGKRGRGAEEKTLVLVAVEDKGNHLGRIRLKVISNASTASISPAIKDCIDPGSYIRTDGWASYASVVSEGYHHKALKAKYCVGDNLLPLANRVASLLKRWLIGTHQGAIQGTHLSAYLDEFTFRFNRRTSRSRGKLFYRLLQNAVVIGLEDNA